MSDHSTPTVEEFRASAKSWLDANLEHRSGKASRRTRGMTHRTVEDIAEQRLLQKRVHEAGFAGITWPVEYGGAGLTEAHERAFDEVAADYVMPDLGIAGTVTIIVCANAILEYASEEFKRRHLPRILSGDELWAEFFSDPAAGSDLAGVTTSATRDGDNWILNGAKIWSSGAYYADFGLCLARTDWDAQKHAGLTWFAVSTTAPGVTVDPLKEITGDIEFCYESFEDVVIADAERIGDVGAGWVVAQTVLRYEREASSGSLTSGAVSLEPGPLAPDLVALARRAGRSDDEHVRQLIVRSHVEDFALRALGARMARLMAEGHPAGPGLVSYTKLAVGMTEPKRAKAAIEIGGTAAVSWDADDLDGLTTSLGYLNARVTSIAGGTNEIQHNAIGERVLGLPREPAFDRGKSFRQIQDDAANWGKRP